jgi:hypothetical protein
VHRTGSQFAIAWQPPPAYAPTARQAWTPRPSLPPTGAGGCVTGIAAPCRLPVSLSHVCNCGPCFPPLSGRRSPASSVTTGTASPTPKPARTPAPPRSRGPPARKVLLARYARNRRLADVIHRWASCTLKGSPGARAYYDRLRASDNGHQATLRQLGKPPRRHQPRLHQDPQHLRPSNSPGTSAAHHLLTSKTWDVCRLTSKHGTSAAVRSPRRPGSTPPAGIRARGLRPHRRRRYRWARVREGDRHGGGRRHSSSGDGAGREPGHRGGQFRRNRDHRFVLDAAAAARRATSRRAGSIRPTRHGSSPNWP